MALQIKELKMVIGDPLVKSCYTLKGREDMGVVVGYPQRSLWYLFILRYVKSNLIDTMTTLTYNISIALITFGIYAKLYKVYSIYSGNSPQGPVTVFIDYIKSCD
jgi:hypothetical protein